MLPRDQLVQVVAEDLEYIRDEWNEQIDDPALRRGSVVLRRLLVENGIQRAWKRSGFPREPTVHASALSDIVGSAPRDRIQFASAGGARFRGVAVGGVLMANYKMPEDEVPKLDKAGPPGEDIGLRRFTESPVAVIDGKEIVRRVLIKFIANKLGGAHYDGSRATRGEVSLYRHLDRATKQIKVLGKPVVYFELLAVGQQLAQSTDIARLIALRSSG